MIMSFMIDTKQAKNIAFHFFPFILVLFFFDLKLRGIYSFLLEDLGVLKRAQ